MNFTQAVAVLLVEPYSQRLADIVEMDDAQIATLFFPERDRDERPLPERKPDGAEEATVIRNPRDLFFWACHEKGMEDETIKALWKARLAKYPHLGENGLPKKRGGRGG